MEREIRQQDDGSSPHSGPVHVVAQVVGFVLLAAMGVLILVSGLIMPFWAVLTLAAVWIVALVVAIRGRTTPAVVLLVPIAMLAIWVATAWLGDRFLDWTA